MRPSKLSRRWLLIALTTALMPLAMLSQSPGTARTAEVLDLPSWSDGASKKSIVDFVEAVTKKDGPDYVKPEERIAVFDNDGTLWCEMPIYPQVVFLMNRAKTIAATKGPEIQNLPLVRAATSGDIQTLTSMGPKGTQDLVNILHPNLTVGEFEKIVSEWIATAKHPRFNQPYTDCVYQPMIEVIAYLKKNGFTTYIVSGGGTDFMRPWTEKTYGIVPEHVIGSTCKLDYSSSDGEPKIMRLPEIDFINDKDRKPVAIERAIGRRPIAAFGNSNGDQQMLEWTAAGKGKRLALLVHHTDSKREYKYDRDSKVGRLDKALDEANEKGWTVVDMKNDWKRVFAFESD
ncbi:MAG: haloacid dehalogenase-like hydrolase [Candidatus Obscuribacterales bacterium]|nr:haloacid dehalogenase-like hydrolase [Candidatus Obscuribacterales bacterium]